MKKLQKQIMVDLEEAVKRNEEWKNAKNDNWQKRYDALPRDEYGWIDPDAYGWLAECAMEEDASDYTLGPKMVMLESLKSYMIVECHYDHGLFTIAECEIHGIIEAKFEYSHYNEFFGKIKFAAIKVGKAYFNPTQLKRIIIKGIEKVLAQEAKD